MDIKDFLSRLQRVKGPSGNGEYMARCPAHDDKTASLSIRDSDKGILMHCQTGRCSADDIVRAMGLTLKDLFHDEKDTVPGMTVHTVKKQAKKQYMSYEEAYGWLGKFVCAYVYRDEKGKPLFEVARIDTSEKEGKRAKTFRQHRLVGAGWTFPLEMGVPDKLKDTLYHLPEVREAIRKGEPVYVVEGEKDADTLASLGKTATTQVMGAGKWRDAHAAHLKGADVIILPDNDSPGREHAQKVADALMKSAKTVKIIDLTGIDQGLPEKGDISDVVARMGASQAMGLLEKAVQDAEPIEEQPLTERDRAAQMYDKVYGYCVDHGKICQETQDGKKPLANFVVLPVQVVTKDDGVNQTKTMVFDGWTEMGQKLPRVEVKAANFEGMKWITEAWDFSASLMPGQTNSQKVAYAIKAVGSLSAQRITQYQHTGWRKIDGKWAYLYHGGAIGADNVTVDLGNGLSLYTLDSQREGYKDITFLDGCRETLKLMNVMDKHVCIPMLGTIFLAPMREFLCQTGVAPAYALFLLGGTGTRKSTVLALMLSHFGNFTSKSLPASFNDTANFIRKKAFLLKDAPIVVDDYHPVTSLQERKKMEATAQSLARAFGDGAERGRMKSDLTLQESCPPRSVAIISGEDTPGVGESGMARFYVVSVDKDDVPATEMLTQMQEKASQGYLQKTMRGYIKWLLAQVERLPQTLNADFLRLRAQALKETKGQHGRTAEAIAHMMLGYQYMLLYMRDAGAITTDQAKEMQRDAWDVVTSNSKKQSEDMKDDRPSKQFLTMVAELIDSRSAYCREVVPDEAKKAPVGKEMIGYQDDKYYYFLPSVAYRAVAKLCADQGQAFPLTPKMLYRQMKEDGVLVPDVMDKGSATKVKSIDGKSQRLLWVSKVLIDGKKTPSHQTKMDISGMEIVDDEDPF